MTDISQLPRWQRLDEVQRKKAQHHLVNAAGLTGLTASGMGGARWMARNTPAGGMRSAPVARAAKIARGSKFGRALGATTAAAGVLGAGSTLTWGASLGREIKRDEAKLRAQNLVKADSWRNHVSPADQQGHAYLKRGERDKKSLAALPGATGAAGAGLLGREASRYFDRNELRNATGRHIGYSRWNVRGRASGKRALASSALLSGSVALAPAAYRQWKEANRWRDKAGKIEARGRDRMNVGKSLKHQYGVGLGAPEYVPATLMSSHDRKQSIEQMRSRATNRSLYPRHRQHSLYAGRRKGAQDKEIVDTSRRKWLRARDRAFTRGYASPMKNPVLALDGVGHAVVNPDFRSRAARSATLKLNAKLGTDSRERLHEYRLATRAKAGQKMDRWATDAGRSMARSRNRKLAAGAAGTAVFGSLGTGIALKRRRERIGKSMPLSEIGKAFAMPRIRIKPLAAPIKRTSPIRRGTFVRTPAGQTTYRRGSL